MKITMRILATPFVFCLILISMLWHTFKRTYLFLRYGGEMITYDEKINPGTIEAVFNEVRNQNYNSEMDFNTKLYGGQ